MENDLVMKKSLIIILLTWLFSTNSEAVSESELQEKADCMASFSIKQVTFEMNGMEVIS
jgi:hypothetical protein